MSRADDVQELSSGTQKECRNNSSQNHLYISQKELPYTTRGLPQKVKIQTPIEMKVFGCLIFEGAITSIVNWRVFTETLGKRKFTYYR